MNRAIPIRAAEPSPPRDETASDVSASLTDVSLEQASYRRFDRRHDTNESTLTREANPGKPSTARPESDEATTTPPTPSRDVSSRDVPSPDGDDPAFTLRSLLRLHAADLIVTLRQWSRRLDTREATLDLRAAHLNLLQRRSRATPRPHDDAIVAIRTPADHTGPTSQTAPPAETGPPEDSIPTGISREWRDELAAQRLAIERLRHDADRFANRLESTLS